MCVCRLVRWIQAQFSYHLWTELVTLDQFCLMSFVLCAIWICLAVHFPESLVRSLRWRKLLAVEYLCPMGKMMKPRMAVPTLRQIKLEFACTRYCVFLFKITDSFTCFNHILILGFWKLKQAIAGISHISFGEEESVSPKKPASLPEVAKQRELSGTMESEDNKLNKQLSDAKFKELSGQDIFAPPPEIKPRPVTARILELKGSIDIGDSHVCTILSCYQSLL